MHVELRLRSATSQLINGLGIRRKEKLYFKFGAEQTVLYLMMGSLLFQWIGFYFITLKILSSMYSKVTVFALMHTLESTAQIRSSHTCRDKEFSPVFRQI